MVLQRSAAAAVGAFRSAFEQRLSQDEVAKLSPDEADLIGLEDEDWLGPEEKKEYKAITERTEFNVVIGIIIVINAIVIGIETDDLVGDEGTSMVIENIFCVIFFVELIFRLCCERLRFFLSAWNLLDVTLVSATVADVWVFPLIFASSQHRGGLYNFSILRVMRLIRIVRVVRLLRMFKELWLLVVGLAQATKTLFWVGMLLVLIMYICAIFTTKMIGQGGMEMDTLDQEEHFGTVALSMFSLFQIMTLSQWTSIVRPVMHAEPLFAVFFILFMLLTTFGLTNLIIGIIVDTTMAASRNNEDKLYQQSQMEKKRILSNLYMIFKESDANKNGYLTMKELAEAVKQNPSVQKAIQSIDMPVSEAKELFRMLDKDGSGDVSVEEFIRGCMRIKVSAKTPEMAATYVGVQALLKHTETLIDSVNSLTINEKRRSSAAMPQVLGNNGHGAGTGSPPDSVAPSERQISSRPRSWTGHDRSRVDPGVGTAASSSSGSDYASSDGAQQQSRAAMRAQMEQLEQKIMSMFSEWRLLADTMLHEAPSHSPAHGSSDDGSRTEPALSRGFSIGSEEGRHIFNNGLPIHDASDASHISSSASSRSMETASETDPEIESVSDDVPPASFGVPKVSVPHADASHSSAAAKRAQYRNRRTSHSASDLDIVAEDEELKSADATSACIPGEKSLRKHLGKSRSWSAST